MPTWIIDLIPLTPWLAVLAALVWLAAKVWPFLRKITHFIDDVAGEPARTGIEARPGLMERLATVEQKQDDQGQKLDVVQHEVTTNHGSSLKDAVKKLERKFDDHLETRNGNE